MKKAFYTTPVTNVMEVETTGNILSGSDRLDGRPQQRGNAR